MAEPSCSRARPSVRPRSVSTARPTVLTTRGVLASVCWHAWGRQLEQKFCFDCGDEELGMSEVPDKYDFATRSKCFALKVAKGEPRFIFECRSISEAQVCDVKTVVDSHSSRAGAGERLWGVLSGSVLPSCRLSGQLMLPAVRGRAGSPPY